MTREMVLLWQNSMSSVISEEGTEHEGSQREEMAEGDR
jgi:hypothetical protein